MFQVIQDLESPRFSSERMKHDAIYEQLCIRVFVRAPSVLAELLGHLLHASL